MAHNINLGTAAKAKRTFEQAISLNPEDRRANYLFGMFLASTQTFHFDGLPYLEKAYSLGEKDAQFTIGLLLVEKGEKEKGLAMLEASSKEHPESEHTRKVIESIKNGSLEFHQSDR
jgi:Tfp pilus assembly protein PilF